MIETNDPGALLAYLAARDIRLTTDGKRLQVDARKGALTSHLRSMIAAQKSSIIDFLAQREIEREAMASAESTVRPKRPDTIYASFTQQRLWFLDRFDHQKQRYNIPFFWRITGLLQAPVLGRALNEIVARHDVLRTCFKEPKGADKEPYQVVSPELTIDIPLLDWSDLSRTEQDEQINQLVRGFAETPFDLSTAPLLRCQLVRLSSSDHVFLLCIHHSVFDGPSLAIFLRELTAIYQAFSRSAESPLPALEMSYADYSLWQRTLLSGSRLHELVAFWQKHLHGAPPLIDLPGDRPRPALPSFQGGRVRIELDKALTSQLEKLSRANHATLFMTLYAAFAVLVSRYTNERDLVIGTPIANRGLEYAESLLGFFANTLAIRLRLSPEQPFIALLQETKQALIQAHNHQDLPFEKLVDALKVERSLQHNPLFQVMFTFQDNHLEHFNVPGLAIQPIEQEQSYTKFDLTLISRHHGDTLVFIFEHSADLFDVSTIERMAQNFMTLLRGVVAQPTAPVARLPLVSPSEETLTRAKLTQSTVDYDKSATVHQLFQDQAARCPHQTAVVFDDRSITYQKLDALTNQLARHLIELGVEPDTVVGLYLEKSLEMMVAVLAVLKAGGAYLPLDPNQPDQRLALILEDCATPLVLTQDTLLDRLTPHLSSGQKAITVDRIGRRLATLSSQGLEPRSGPDNLAYVIYTSGSTGVPKGVLTPHSALLDTYHAYRVTYRLPELASHLQMANYAFDLFTGDWVRALCSGSKLVLCRPEYLGDPARLYQLMVAERIEYAHFVPAVVRRLCDYLHDNGLRLDFLKCSAVGADVYHVKDYRRLRALCGPDARVLSVYGVTEATVESTCTDRIDSSLPGDLLAPVGWPMANTRIYIVDEHENLTPIGVPGEICIAGPGLAKGYLERPELNAKKFVDIELMGEKTRVYKSGDLGRWRPAEGLEFIGRLDTQVKLRGLRIELGEIEAALLQHEAVKEAVVLLSKNHDDLFLAAYVVLAHELDDVSYAMRSWLETRVPGYMVPASYLALDALPWTHNGKIDRRALPEPEARVTSARYVAPRDSVELRLVLLWEKLLGFSPVSVTDRFFEIGGDSLLSLRLISAVDEDFGVRIPVHTLFQNSTIEQMAITLRKKAVSTTHSSLVCIQPEGSKAPLFFVHAAGGIVFRYIQVAALLGKDRPFYGIQARGVEPGDEPHATIEEMAEDYVRAIREVQPRGPYLLGGWSFGGTVAFEMARLLEKAGQPAPLILMVDPPSPHVDSYAQDDVEFLMERLEPAAGLDLGDVHSKGSREEKLLYLFNEQKLAGLLAPDIDISEAKWRLGLHMHHNKIMCEYRPTGPCNGKIVFFKPTESIPFDTRMKNPVAAWTELCRGGMDVYDAPGNHFNMFSPANGPILAQTMKTIIAELE